jgi:hypothetical protein
MSIEDQMHLIGRILGWIIFAGYVWLTLNYFLKQFDGLRRGALMRAVSRSHVYVPLFILTIILLHLLMELIHVGFFITGVITVSLMAAQIGLGLYGAYVKKRVRGSWFYWHRTVAVLLFFSIAAHVVTVIVLNP